MEGKGMFCEIFGDTVRTRVLECFLENSSLDVAVGDLAEEAEISRPRAYHEIYALLAEGIVKKTRMVGKTQLYALEKTNPRSRLLLKTFKDCLRLIAIEEEEPMKIHIPRSKP